MLPIPLKGYWVNRSSLEYVNEVHECPRDVGNLGAVCPGGVSPSNTTILGLGNAQYMVKRRECWLPHAYPDWEAYHLPDSPQVC